MAKYTEVLHDLLTNEETNNLIKKAMNSYKMYNPIHKELYGYIPTREELNKKILDHYRWYEIGSETVGRFLYNLETTLNEIMPYYNQMYKSVDIMNGIEDIFSNVDVTETFEENKTGKTSNDATENIKGNVKGDSSNNVTSENTSNTDINSNGRNVKSTTPQSQLAVKTIDNITAASEINWNEDNSNSKLNSNEKSNTISNTQSETSQENKMNSSQSTEDKTSHTFNKKGNQGVNTYAHDMLEFRQLLLNIEQQIINDPELAKCFMLIW